MQYLREGFLFLSYAMASLDYKTTSQQDNEWGFASATPDKGLGTND
ncbi:MAG: hypothetical protein J6V33_00665 [Bacteroidales bacterium]|nr:hypothetical protein [Bacteroidales bacterium]